LVALVGNLPQHLERGHRSTAKESPEAATNGE